MLVCGCLIRKVIWYNKFFFLSTLSNFTENQLKLPIRLDHDQDYCFMCLNGLGGIYVLCLSLAK